MGVSDAGVLLGAYDVRMGCFIRQIYNFFVHYDYWSPA